MNTKLDTKLAILIVVAISSLVLIWSMSKIYNFEDTDGSFFPRIVKIKKSSNARGMNSEEICATKGLSWNKETKQCSEASKELCEKNGGKFNPCGSACSPGAAACVQVCVPQCNFQK